MTIRGETYLSVIPSFPAQRRGEPENNRVSVIASFPAQRRGESQRTIQILWYIRAEVGENVSS